MKVNAPVASVGVKESNVGERIASLPSLVEIGSRVFSPVTIVDSLLAAHEQAIAGLTNQPKSSALVFASAAEAGTQVSNTPANNS